MDTFFFLPGSKLHNAKRIIDLGVTELVVDLEDGIRRSQIDTVFSAFSDWQMQFFFRIPVYSPEYTSLDLELLQKYIQLGCRKFVLPKIEGAQHLQSICHTLPPNVELILLIENPKMMLELGAVLSSYQTLIRGIALGSHDFIAETGGEYSLENLAYARQQTLYLARSIGAMAIDIVSMELKDKDSLTREIVDGFKKGYDAKFIIHPWQLEVFQDISFYTEEDKEWAQRINSELTKVKNKLEFSPVIVNGQIIERPHLRRVERILTYFHDRQR